MTQICCTTYLFCESVLKGGAFCNGGVCVFDWTMHERVLLIRRLKAVMCWSIMELVIYADLVYGFTSLF